MRKKYILPNLLFISFAFLVATLASCKKDKPVQVTTVQTANPTQLGLYESDSSIYKLLIVAVSQVGTKTAEYPFVFDTGSGGMVIDADGILPASMITSTGFSFTGDSTIVNGITITSQTSTVEYGDDATTADKVYGNLAYAAVTVGDQNGSFVIKRLPFMIYYKAVDKNNKTYPVHEFDTFGVSEEYDITFPSGAYITSPFSYYDPGAGLTKGFKMAVVNANNFTLDGAYVPGAVTLGLTAADLSSSSGFTMSQLTYYPGDGYAPIIPATLTYNNKAGFSTNVLFDTGTEPYSYIEDPTAPSALTLLPQNVSVSTATNSGFNYAYTTSLTDNLTYTENPSTSGTDVTIFGLESFLNNEYMLDFAHHKLGLKKN